jgi:hypothetical protein
LRTGKEIKIHHPELRPGVEAEVGLSEKECTGDGVRPEKVKRLTDDMKPR